MIEEYIGSIFGYALEKIRYAVKGQKVGEV